MTKKTETRQPRSIVRIGKPQAETSQSNRPHSKAPRKKTKASKQVRDLKAERDELRARLVEAEDTIQAIRNGDVDALVISEDRGEQVFTLKGAEQIYRVLVEEMSEAAVTLNTDGFVLFSNNALVSMLELPLDKIMGSPLQRYILAESRSSFQSFIKRCMHGSAKIEVKMKKESGALVHVLLSGRKLSFENEMGWISIVMTDMTPQKQIEMLLRQGHEELEKKVQERTWDLKIHEIELETQNEELRFTQQQLESSQHNFSELYDFAPVGYFSLTLSGTISQVNQTGARLLGTEKQTLLNKPFSVFIADARDKDLFIAHKKATFRTQSAQTCELRLRKADRSIFHARLYSMAAENVDDKSGCIRTTVTDITERKLAEEALRESENTLQSFFNGSSFMMGVMELDGSDVSIVHGNRALAAFFKSVSKGLVGRTGTELGVPPAILHSWTEHLRRAQLEGTPAWFEYEHPKPSGNRWLNVSVSFLKESRRGRARFSFVAEDITERQRMQEVVRKSEEKYRSIVETANEGVWVVDADRRTIYVNAQMATMLGYSAQEMIGKSVFDFLDEEGKALSDINIEKRRQGVKDSFELKLIRKDKSPIWTRVNAAPFSDDGGKFEGSLSMITDTTERRLVEEKARRQNALLDGINRIFEAGLTCDTEEELGIACLQVAEAITQSKFGFLGQIGPDGLLRNIALSDPGWALCTMRDQSGHRRPPGYFKIKGLYGYVLTTGKSFFTNDPASHPQSSGLPEGHPPLACFLGTPLILHNKTIGMVGLANREGGYRAEDQEALDALVGVIVQVYLRMQAESGLRKNRERLREYVSLLEYAPLMVRNSKEEIILWNKGMERMYGYSSAEAIGQQSHDFLRTEFTKPLGEIMNQVADSGTWEGEIRHSTRDGRTISVSSLWVLHKNADGQATAVIEVNSDITALRRAEEELRKLNEELESRVRARTADLARTITTLQNEIADRKAAEKALRESQLNLSKAQSIAHIGSWTYDMQTADFVASDEFYSIFGLKKTEAHVDLHTILNTVHSDDRDKVRQKFKILLSQFKIEPVDYRIVLPDGAVRTISSETELIQDAANKPLSIVGTVQDITERKRAEEEMARLAFAIESAADALAVTDPVLGIIQYVNPAFEKISGYARDEVIGRDLHILDSGKHDELFYQQIRETLQRDGCWTGRLVQKKKDGTLYEEECTYSLVKNAAGEVINYIAIKRDITEKLRFESIAQAVETMNNIGYIFSGVCHEIGNPVNAMKITLDVLKRRSNELPPEKIADYIDKVASQVARVDDLLASLKNFNMYQTMQPRTIDTASFTDKFLEMIRQDFEAKGIAIGCELGRQCSWLLADPRALQQVLLNIFTNAADAVAGSTNPRISLLVSSDGDRTTLQISDNGTGISEAGLKDLFKPFYTTKQHGTGLGLVIIRKMLAKMNGTVEIRSKLNEGTVVEISLPAADRETA